MNLLLAAFSRFFMLCNTFTFIGTESCFDRYISIRRLSALSTKVTYTQESQSHNRIHQRQLPGGVTHIQPILQSQVGGQLPRELPSSFIVDQLLLVT